MTNRRPTGAQWDIDGDQLLVITCTGKAGNEVRSEEAIELRLCYDNGALIPEDK